MLGFPHHQHKGEPSFLRRRKLLIEQPRIGTLHPIQHLVAPFPLDMDALLTGLLGIGVGHILPQLVRFGCMALPVAAGPSVAVVGATNGG